MASYREKNKNEPFLFKSEIHSPHFFKIILDDSIKKLGIPKKFARRYGNHLSSKVFLQVPNGPKWQVQLIKSGKDIWFGKGFQRFVDYYSLSFGSFLVFRFENLKSCCFNVIIFDKTASEIDYPIHVNGDSEETNQQITPEINEIDVSSPEKLEEKLISPFSRPRKKMKQENGFGLPIGGLDFATAAKRCKRDIVVNRTQTLTGIEKANALSRANSSYQSNNLSFSIAMQPTHVRGKCRVAIPASFTKKYIEKERGNINLTCADGKTWSVGYICIEIRGLKVARICQGWRKFVEANHLEVGDVCVFELISNENATKFKVVVCRKNQDAKTIRITECTDNIYGEM